MSDCFPREFLCEHTPSKSRVYAVLVTHCDGTASSQLKAVLTCADPGLAEDAATVLTANARSDSGPELDARAKRILAALPAAPAASFREALSRARVGRWPAGSPIPAPLDGGALSRDARLRTPDGARLADFTGPVVRIAQLSEFHVHHPERIMASAAALGWTPLEENVAERDTALLAIDAVLFMTNVPELAGTDMISHEVSGQVLDAAAGDEVVPWHVGPVIEEFDAGWLLEEGAADAASSPDFAALFPVRDCNCGDEDCEVCGDWQLTPRTADMLHTALSVMSDEAYHDIDEHGDAPVSTGNRDAWMVFDRLPPITWRQNAGWRRGIAHACEDLVRDLEEGNWPQPRSNAEEIVLHLAIRDAPGLLELAEETQNAGSEALPRHSDDYDWDGCSELLFEDHDILWLYDNRMDGVEDPEDQLNRQYGVGDMRPASWFTFFSHLEPRDPARRFRG